VNAGRLARDRRLWLAAGLVVVLAALHLSGVTQLVSFDTLRAHRGALTAWVARHEVVAALAYAGIYVGVVAFSIPGGVWLTLAGGFFFGAWLGAALAVVGATIGATLLFLVAQRLFGERALDRLGPQASRIAEGLRRDAWSYLLVLRLVPLFPFFLVNLVPAFVGVRLSTFVATTLVGIVPATAVFALAGAGLGAVLDGGGEITASAILTPQIVAGLVGLAALSLAAIPVRRWLESRRAGNAGQGLGERTSRVDP
jgi:uncharacterized membrane protein YdjX (TVP38/TMEM64 family)